MRHPLCFLVINNITDHDRSGICFYQKIGFFSEGELHGDAFDANC